ncbi:MAG TPA: hypothetical protein VF794_18965 [Archangium sp.]|jgi:hypothetical protein|uniref:hypothetical protein n=1 Tax=Archangium sp. TaxID=1872627 RepID=UPI002ED7B05F
MMTRRPLALLALALVGVLLSPPVARAADEKLKVKVEVVLVSKKGTEVEPAELQKMKDSFERQNFNFTSFKRLSQQTLEVGSQASTDVKLPNGVNASLRLLRMQGDTATLRVEVPQLSAVDVELGREGTVYQRAGKHVGGELILVLSSPPGK